MGALSDADRQMLADATDRARARMSGRTIDSDGQDERTVHPRITEHLWLRYDDDGVLQALWLPIGVIPTGPAENLRRERTRCSCAILGGRTDLRFIFQNPARLIDCRLTIQPNRVVFTCRLRGATDGDNQTRG
jgi:hypothetical protein